MVVSYRFFKYFPELVLLIIFFVIQLQHINADFWNDELYTLKHFVFTSFFTTITDYHVPNNHVFFNLLNNAYIKITNVGSLHSLMDHPYRLRILSIFYSLLVLVVTYSVANQFLNRTVGLLSVVVLMTTIAFHNFSHQIRGYALSTLFLMIIVYLCLAYLKSHRRHQLFLLSFIVCLLIYTIPSNLLPVVSILVFLSCFFLIHHYKQLTWISKNALSNLVYQPSFLLIIAIITGVGMALCFYSWIFTDVFFNSYVESKKPFQLSQLTFYVPHITDGFASQRWMLLILFLTGFAINFAQIKKWLSPLFLFLAICTLPILMVYIRGDKAPLRVFVVIMPLMSLISAIGLYAFWGLIKKWFKYDLLFIAIVLVYCLITFRGELKAIDQKLLNDIITNKRSQQLDYQYYADRYQPLEDVGSFKENHYNKKYPVIVKGCEPHGITNYLKKFKIEFCKWRAFDSLVAKYDSIYIVTNHPNRFSTSPDFEVKRLNDKLTYHNFILYHQKKSYKNLVAQNLNKIKAKHKDSIEFVFNITHPTSVFTLVKDTPKYLITNSNKHDIGRLLRFTNTTPYLCYIQTAERNMSNIICNLRHQRKKIISAKCVNGIKILVLKEDTTTQLPYESFGKYDFEKRKGNKGKNWDSLYTFEGMYSEKLDSTNPFSSSLTIPPKEVEDYKLIKISLWARIGKNEGGKLVFQGQKNDTTDVWRSVKMNNYYQKGQEWHQVVGVFHLTEELKRCDSLQTFIWNPKKTSFWIDNFQVEALNIDTLASIQCYYRTILGRE